MNTAPLCPITPARLDQLMAEIFFAGRSARSPEYQQGCRAALSQRLAGVTLSNQYAAGTAAADAWWAGWDEGVMQADVRRPREPVRPDDLARLNAVPASERGIQWYRDQREALTGKKTGPWRPESTQEQGAL